MEEGGGHWQCWWWHLEGGAAGCWEAPGCVFTAPLQTVVNSFHRLGCSQMGQGRRGEVVSPPGLMLRDLWGTAEDGRASAMPLTSLGSGFKFSFISLNVMLEGLKT